MQAKGSVVARRGNFAKHSKEKLLRSVASAIVEAGGTLPANRILSEPAYCWEARNITRRKGGNAVGCERTTSTRAGTARRVMTASTCTGYPSMPLKRGPG